MATEAPIGKHWHPRLIEAAMALNDNRLDVAERILKPHLKEDPFDAAAIRMLAELAARIGRMTGCGEFAAPRHRNRARIGAARANLALVLGRIGRPAEALELLDDLFAVDPDDISVLNLRRRRLGSWVISTRRSSYTRACWRRHRTSLGSG